VTAACRRPRNELVQHPECTVIGASIGELQLLETGESSSRLWRWATTITIGYDRWAGRQSGRGAMLAARPTSGRWDQQGGESAYVLKHP